MNALKVTRHPLGDAYVLADSQGRRFEGYVSGDYVQAGDSLRQGRYQPTGKIPLTDKAVVKVSVMSGCPYSCAPCDAGRSGFGGMASAQDMLDQLTYMLDDQNLEHCRKLKLHVSKLGEPSLNWHATRDFIAQAAELFPALNVLPVVSTLPRGPRRWDRLRQDFFAMDLPVKQLKINAGSTCESTRRRWFGRTIPLPSVLAALAEDLPGAHGDQRVTITFLAAANLEVDTQVLLDAVPRSVRPRIAVELYKVNATENAAEHGLTSAVVRYKDADAYRQPLDRLRDAGFFVYVSAPSNGEQAAHIANGSNLTQTL